MKRQKEINNLIENVQQNICDNCRRWNGDFYDNNAIDIYKCKYNTDNKGLYVGLCVNHPQNYKFKYFNYKPIQLNKDKKSFELLELIGNQIVDYDMCVYNFKEYKSLAIERAIRR